MLRKAWCHAGAVAALLALGLFGCGGGSQAVPPDDGPPESASPTPRGPTPPGDGARAGSSARDSVKGTPVSASDPAPDEVGAPPNDTCAGEQVALAGGVAAHITGTLVGAADDYTTFCADKSDDPGNPDVVYELDVAEEVSLTASLVANGFVPALSLRLKACTEEVGGDVCLDFGGQAEHAQLGLLPGQYWLVVDSADGNVGSFSLDLYAQAPRCGDGILNTGEQCDPGACAPDDGCYDAGTKDQCKLGEPTSDPSLTACPGYGPVNVPLSTNPQTPAITTLGPHNNGAGAHLQQNDITPDPNVCGWPAVGPENVYHVVPSSNGTLYARIGYNGAGVPMCDLNPNCADFILYMRSGSCTPANPPSPDQQLACEDFDPNDKEVLTISSAVTAGSDYWVFVDGLDDAYGIGPYYLELWLMP